MDGLDREHFMVAWLDIKGRLIGLGTVSIGSLCMTMANPREVFRPAIIHSAASIIVGHNHPSGDMTPSPDDIKTTHRLAEAGKLLDIPVLDHFITSGSEYKSIAQECNL